MKNSVLLVCGFGRCGSSLVMQMLEAGGFHVTGRYPAFECDIAMFGPQDRDWQAMTGKAVKLLDPQRHTLPTDIPFKAIWIDRDHAEQAKSQRKFAAAFMGLRLPRAAEASLRVSYKADRPAAIAAIAPAPILFLTFERILNDPQTAANLIDHHVSGGLDTSSMAAVVRPRSPKCLPHMLELELLNERKD